MKYRYIQQGLSTYETEEQKPFVHYQVKSSEVNAAEKEIGQAFPADLKEFWLDVGCGLILKQYPLRNDGMRMDPAYRILGPDEVVYLIKSDPERFEGVIPFLDLSDNGWLVICDDGEIMFDDLEGTAVANSFNEFMVKLFDNARCLIDDASLTP